eukprot:g8781.t1
MRLFVFLLFALVYIGSLVHGGNIRSNKPVRDLFVEHETVKEKIRHTIDAVEQGNANLLKLETKKNVLAEKIELQKIAEAEKERQAAKPNTPSRDCKEITVNGKVFYGTIASGFTSKQVVEGADKLISLLGMASGLLGATVGAQVKRCGNDYKQDIIEQLLPRCDEKCQVMKQCKTSCEALKSKCISASLQAYFPMVKKGGSMRGMLPMIGLSESDPFMKVIDAWLEKLDKCNSEYVTDAKVCLSAKYTATSATTVIANTPPIDLPVENLEKECTDYCDSKNNAALLEVAEEPIFTSKPIPELETKEDLEAKCSTWCSKHKPVPSLVEDKKDVSVDDILKAQKEISEGRVDKKGNEYAQFSWISRAGMGSRLVRQYLTLHRQQHIQEPPTWQVKSTIKQELVFHAERIDAITRSDLISVFTKLLDFYVSHFNIDRNHMGFLGVSGKCNDPEGMRLSFQISLPKYKERVLRFQLEQLAMGNNKYSLELATDIKKHISDKIREENRFLYNDDKEETLSNKTDAEMCYDYCQSKSFCCNDYKTGSNQLLSCAQACMIRMRDSGLSKKDCKANYCDGKQNGCSLEVKGFKYDMCQKCSDLTDKCPHGVQDEKPCMAGCDMDVPYRRDDNMDVVQVDIGVPSETEEAPTGNTGSTGSETDMTGVDEDVVGGASPSETGSTTEEPTDNESESTGPEEQEDETGTGNPFMEGCKKVVGLNGNEFYGTIADGFTAKEVIDGSNQIILLLDMVSNFGIFPADTVATIKKCKNDYKTDMMQQLLPRCDDKCQPMKQCKSACGDLKSDCIPDAFRSQLNMILPGGAYRSMVSMQAGGENSATIKVMDAWLSKLNTCESEHLTSDEFCLSPKYTGAMCDPDAIKKALSGADATGNGYTHTFNMIGKKCESYLDQYGYHLLAHNVGTRFEMEKFVKGDESGDRYIMPFCSPFDKTSCINPNFMNFKNLKGAEILEQIKLEGQKETLHRTYTWDQDTFAGTPSSVTATNGSNAKLRLWLGNTKGPGFSAEAGHHKCANQGAFYPTKVGTKNVFFAWSSYEHCSGADGLLGALGHFPDCTGCTEDERKYGVFKRGMYHEGKKIQVKWSNLWIKGGSCDDDGIETDGEDKDATTTGEIVYDGPIVFKNTSAGLVPERTTHEEGKILKQWKALNHKTAESAAIVINRWSDYEKRDRIKEILSNVRPFVRGYVRDTMRHVESKLIEANKEQEPKLALVTLKLIHDVIKANEVMDEETDNIKRFEHMVFRMDRNTLFYFEQSLTRKSQYKLIEACQSSQRLRKRLLEEGFSSDLLQPIALQQEEDDFERLKSKFQKTLAKHAKYALFDSKVVKALVGTTSGPEMLKLLSKEQLEKTYKSITDKKAAGKFKLLQLKTNKCESFHNMPMCNAKSFEASSTSALLSNSHKKIADGFNRLKKAFQATKRFFGKRMTDKCLRLLQKSTCNALLPRCNDKCEAQPPCKSTCEETAEECKLILTPISLSVFRNGGALNTIVTGIMGENMPLFQRVLNISKQCTDDIYDPSREGCSSLLSENKINCTPEKMPKMAEDVAMEAMQRYVSTIKKHAHEMKAQEKVAEREKQKKMEEDKKVAEREKQEKMEEDKKVAEREKQKKMEEDEKVAIAEKSKKEKEAKETNEEEEEDKDIKNPVDIDGSGTHDEKVDSSPASTGGSTGSDSTGSGSTVEEDKGIKKQLLEPQASTGASESLDTTASSGTTDESGNDDKVKDVVKDINNEAEELDKEKEEKAAKEKEEKEKEEKEKAAKEKEEKEKAAKVKAAKEKAAKEKAAKEKAAKEKAAKESSKCIKIDASKLAGCGEKTFSGTNTFGLDQKDVATAFNVIFKQALPMVQQLLPGIPKTCIPSINKEMCSLFFPSCSIDCKERKSCRSTCKGALKECGPLAAQLGLVSKGGPFEPMIKAFFAGQDTVWNIAQNIIKHLTCTGDNFSDDKLCSTIQQNSVACATPHPESAGWGAGKWRRL